MKYILVLDQGTTSTRAFIFNEYAEIVASAQEEFPQQYPQAGYVEHDPKDIIKSVENVLSAVFNNSNLLPSMIDSMGITNQRETVVAWNLTTGEPLCNAIVWQCRRTAKRCKNLEDEGYGNLIQQKTGLKIDAYFSATKMEWILEHVPAAKECLLNNELGIGTIDTYLMWYLSKGKIYKTDYTNASRTMLFNIHSLSWDEELCSLFKIPENILPTAHPSGYQYGSTDHSLLKNIPICGIAGDQQASLFGQLCCQPGDLKVTYGTGCFLLMITGETAITSKNGLITSIGCSLEQHPTYVLEGSVFIGGALVQWLRDQLGIIETAAETETLAKAVDDTNGVTIVPAFVGLGAPYWDPTAEGIITGLTRGTNKNHLVRASLEAIAYQVHDVIMAMEKDTLKEISRFNADGGAAVNGFLMQFQADITKMEVIRPRSIEATALGVAYLSGLTRGIWKSISELKKLKKITKIFFPLMSEEKRRNSLHHWYKALGKSLTKALPNDFVD